MKVVLHTGKVTEQPLNSPATTNCLQVLHTMVQLQ
jgi:hypothetical protein